MRRTMSMLQILLLTAAMTLTSFAAGKKYGKPLTLQETTKISDIFAQPEKYNGKRVKVQGPVVDVCSMRGCWIALGSDQEFQKIRFKVDDGVIVFPMDAKGSNAVVEGVVTITTVSVEEQLKHGEEMAKQKKSVFDKASVTGPKTEVQIKGEGAEIF